MKNRKIVTIGYGNVTKVKIGKDLPLAFVGGPCAIENRDHTLFMAEKIKHICDNFEHQGPMRNLVLNN